MIYTVTLNPALDRELTVADIRFNHVLRANSWRVDPGGKGFNVSRMLLALGGGSIALGFAGGFAGQQLRAALEQAGVSTDFVPVAGETRTNVSIVSPSEGRYIKVNEPGPTVGPTDMQALFDRVQALLRPGDWWVLAGSLPPGAPANTYATMITLIQGAGARVVLDASGQALREALGAQPFLIKPNETELAEATEMPADDWPSASRAAQSLLQRGVKHVVVSRGADGAMWVSADGAVIVQAPPVAEQNPIGAGDSLVAGLVWGLSQGLPPGEALRWGVACGAAAAATSGTGVGDRATVTGLWEQTEVDVTEAP